MSKILIIEDEKMERETLEKIIVENFTEVTKVYVAKNGFEALEMYEKHHPELILADINIPGINGLEVMKKIKKDNSAVEFLVISSYNYFEYAQEAIRLGVADFILKPYNITDLVNVLSKLMHKQKRKKREKEKKEELINKIASITPVVENECLYAILSNERDYNLKNTLKLLNFRINNGFCFILQKEEYNWDLMKEIPTKINEAGYRCIKEYFHDLMIFFVLYDTNFSVLDLTKLEEIINSFDLSTYQIGIGSIESDVNEFYNSYLCAKNSIHPLMNCKIKLFSSKAVEVNETEIDLNEYVERIMNSYDVMDEDLFRKIVESLKIQIVSIYNSQSVMEVLKELYNSLMEAVKEKYPDLDISQIKMQEMSTHGNLYREVEMFLNINLNRIGKVIIQNRFKNTNHLTKQAIIYIEKNYKKQITLNDLADELEVSPFYVCKVLSNELHKTFTEIVSDYRIEAAKVMLKSNKRIKEIAFEVGFQGQNYFSKIFKKYTGVTPKTYRSAFHDDKDF
ncbi:MAG: response regulator [Erysipelotrichaceae bacterium]